MTKARIHTHTIQYLLLSHDNNGYANAPQYYVIRTLPVLCALFFSGPVLRLHVDSKRIRVRRYGLNKRQGGGDRSTAWKTCPSATLPKTNPTSSALRSKPFHGPERAGQGIQFITNLPTGLVWISTKHIMTFPSFDIRYSGFCGFRPNYRSPTHITHTHETTVKTPGATTYLTECYVTINSAACTKTYQCNNKTRYKSPFRVTNHYLPMHTLLQQNTGCLARQCSRTKTYYNLSRWF